MRRAICARRRGAREAQREETSRAGRGRRRLLLVYTSGTTGKPKALLTHANCFWTNLGFDLATGVSGDDVVLQVLPQFHCGGWNVQPLLAWWKGATVVLERGFDAARCLQLIADKRVTTTMGVPAIYGFMAQARASPPPTCRACAWPSVAHRCRTLLETWQSRGVEIVQGYRLTEAAPNVLCLPPEDAVRKQGWAGRPYRSSTWRCATADSDMLDGAATGELVVRGPNVFAGYWGNAEATADAFAEGWLLTGDVAERDGEGYYRICGRVKDMYISGGENVYPAEVENVPRARRSCRRGRRRVPDERWGERAPPSSCSSRAASRPPRSSAIGAGRAWRSTRCRARCASCRVATLGDEQGAEGRAGGAARAGYVA